MARLILFGALALSLCTSLAAQQPGSWPGAMSPVHAVAGHELRLARHAGCVPSRIVQRLSGMGSSGVPVLVEILCLAQVPPAVEADAPMILSEPQTQLVLSALRAMPPAEVRAALEDRMLSSASAAGTALGAIDILADIGRGPDWERALALIPLREDGSATREARQRVIPALSRWLRRDAESWSTLQGVLRRITEGRARVLVDAVGDTRDPRGIDLLFACTRRFAGLGPACAAQLRTLPRRNRPDVAAWMAGELVFAAPEYARMLCVALPRYDDGSNLDALVEAVEHGDAKVRGAAEAALREISGQALAGTSAAWRGWLADQRRWLETRLPELAETVRSGAPAQVIAALRECGTARLARLRVAETMLVALGRKEPGVAALATELLAGMNCGELCEQLGSELDAYPQVRERLCGQGSAGLRQP